MAEGLLRHIAGNKYEVKSAGTIASFVRPQAIAVMQEIGIDISDHRSKCLDEFIDQTFDYIITVCDNANQTCPMFPGSATRIHWSFEDPAETTGTDEEKLSVFRRVRDEIHEKLSNFVSVN